MKIGVFITFNGVYYCLLFFHIRVVYVKYFTISENLKTYINIIICKYRETYNLQKFAAVGTCS
jgi:hypothetical protein